MPLLIGEKSLEKIADFLLKIQENTLKIVNENLKKNFFTYSPFMSSFDKLEALFHAGIFDKYQIKNQTQVIIDTEYLLRLKQIYCSQNNNLFAYSECDSTSEVSLWDKELIELHAFSNVINASLSFLSEISDYFYKKIKLLSNYILPFQNLNKNLKTKAFSSYKIFGVLFLSPQELTNSIFDSLLSISHECGHQALMLYQSFGDEIIVNGLDLWVYSGIRKTHRPAILALHAAVALCFMLEFCNIILKSKRYLKKCKHDIDFEYVLFKKRELKEDLYATMDSIDLNCRFTKLGHLIIHELKNFHIF